MRCRLACTIVRIQRSSLYCLIVPAALAVSALRSSGEGDEDGDRGLVFEDKIAPMLENYCFDCHDSDVKKGGLDLTALRFDLDDEQIFETWVKVHDRVAAGEMPPAKKKHQPTSSKRDWLVGKLSSQLIAADHQRAEEAGRAIWRRLNRYEYENTLRDLLDAPWLQVKDILPEDGELHRFNKVGEALNVSHVQIARYLQAAEYALREVMVPSLEKPETRTQRFYARDQRSFKGKLHYSPFNRSPERAVYPLLDHTAQVDVLDKKAPVTVGESDPAIRKREAFGVTAGAYEPLEVKFSEFKTRQPGKYRLRVSAYTFWAGPGFKGKWYRPDRYHTSVGRRAEPVVLYSEAPPRRLRRLGGFNVYPEPTEQELVVWLLKDETIRPDAARLFRSRPPSWHNPLAEKDGQPGVAYRWLEVTGPIHDTWPPRGHDLMFGNLPVSENARGDVEVKSENPLEDSKRLLRRFMAAAYRHPVSDDEVLLFHQLIGKSMDTGSSFTEAMIAGYTAVLTSPAFISLEEHPGRLNSHALASRLSYFLWNSPPDEALLKAAEADHLKDDGAALREQTERLLGDPKMLRFNKAFLAYWLDLKNATATSADETLYPDYYLDDWLTDSSVEETEAFFAELIRNDLPARNIVDSDFVMLNERLARHYHIPEVDGIEIRRVALPDDSVRGGLLTQSSVLKVTANGTTTSPVMRGAWIMERILGQKPPPPPPSVPAIEPDTRGAKTIREQLDKHRSVPSCNGCHQKIDPAGFALESFDIHGGYREHYRALVDGNEDRRVPGFGMNGQPFKFHLGQPVDCTGELPDGRTFADVRALKKLLLTDERMIARNLVRQLLVYGTGAPVRFGDRPEIERILDRAEASEFGVRTLITEIVQSPLFRNK